MAFVIGGLIYLVAAVRLNARRRVPHIAVLTLGAVSLFVGDLLWLLGWAVPDVVLWWLAFLVLTIAGERLELSRLLQPFVWARRGFVQRTFAVGLTVAMATQLLTAAGVAMAQTRTDYTPPHGGGGKLKILWWQAPTGRHLRQTT